MSRGVGGGGSETYGPFFAAPPVAHLARGSAGLQGPEGNGRGVGEEGQDDAGCCILEESATAAGSGEIGVPEVVRLLALSLCDGQWLSSGASGDGHHQLLLGTGGEDAVGAGRHDEGDEQHHGVQELCPEVDDLDGAPGRRDAAGIEAVHAGSARKEDQRGKRRDETARYRTGDRESPRTVLGPGAGCFQVPDEPNCCLLAHASAVGEQNMRGGGGGKGGGRGREGEAEAEAEEELLRNKDRQSDLLDLLDLQTWDATQCRRVMTLCLERAGGGKRRQRRCSLS